MCRSTRAICTWAGDGQWTHGMASFEVGDEDVPLCSFASSAVKSSRKEAHGVAEEEECWGGRRAVGVCPHPLCLPLPPSHPPSSLHPGWQRPSALAGDHVFRVCLPWLSVRSPPYLPCSLPRLLARSFAPTHNSLIELLFFEIKDWRTGDCCCRTATGHNLSLRSPPKQGF